MSAGSSANDRYPAAPDDTSDLFFPTWRVRDWQQPVSYLPVAPPTRPHRSTIVTGAFVAVMATSAVLAFAGITFSVADHSVATALEGIAATLLFVGAPAVAVALRFGGKAHRASRLLFIVSTALLAIVAVAVMSMPGLRWYSLVPLCYLGISAILWFSFGPASLRQSLERRRYDESQAAQLHAALNSRVHTAYDVAETTALPQSDNEYEHFDLYDAYSEPVDAYALDPVFDQLLQIPSVHIVHGIGSSTPGASDRAVAFVAGNRVALVDCSGWDASAYLQSRFASIVGHGFARNPQITLGDNVVERIAGRIPEADVWGWIIAEAGADDVRLIAPADIATKTSVADASTAVEAIGQWLADGGSTVNLLVLRDVLDSRKY